MFRLLAVRNIPETRRPSARSWKALGSGVRRDLALEAAMTEKDPNIVYSSLSRKVTKDGISVEVVIVRFEHEAAWSLEVVNSASTSNVWDTLFATDEAAYAEFKRTVAEEGMRTFLDSGKVIPFRR